MCCFNSELHRGYTEDDSITVHDRRKTFKQKSMKGGHHSLDESLIPDHAGANLKNAISDPRLCDNRLDISKKEKSASKLSLLMDKLAENKSGGDKQKKSKSGITALFRRSKSRDPSPNTTTRSRIPDYSRMEKRAARNKAADMASARSATLPPVRVTDSEGSSIGGPSINVDPANSLIPSEFQEAIGQRRSFHRNMSDMSMSDNEYHSDAEVAEMNALMEMIDEYYYAVRIFPGQDPAQVHVGWVTPSFHNNSKEFDTKKMRHVIVSTLDMDYNMKQRYEHIQHLFYS